MIHTAIVVRAIRRQMGWSRQEMARVMGVSVACLVRVERGEQELDKDAAVRLCEATGADYNKIW